jgi:RHS repeat-associated protein
LSVQDPREVGTHGYSYDTRNRVHTYTDPLAGVETYTYDAIGNLASKLDRKQQTTSYTYDALDRLHVVTYPDSSTLTITWDAGNRPTDFVDSTNGTIHRDYDGLDRMTVERGPQGELDYFYDAANRRDHVSIVGQSQPTIYHFDNANRLTQVAQGSTTLGFGYDAANRRTTVTLPNGIVGAFGFDNANELTSISYDGTAHVADATYGYDAAGRRTSASGTLVRPMVDAVLSAATYDAGNRLSGVGSGTMAYDGNGNLTSSSGTAANAFTWNARNQLVATSNGSTFTYDALGRMVARTTGGVTNNYTYDGWSQILANGMSTLRGPGLDEAYAQITAGTAVSYLKDASGSVAVLTNAAQSTVTGYSYGAYGAAASTGPSGTATIGTPFQYTGADYDSSDQLLYLRNRFYSPQLQRFVSEDPSKFGGGLNLYAYVGGNPISWTDPWGLKPGDPFGSIPDAAVDALNWVYQTYPNANVEYAGSIYQGADGKYYASVPQAGTRNSSKPSYGPGGYRDVDAYYHTHGQCTKGMNGGNDVFSPDDKFIADWHLPFAVPAFLETPGHQVQRYDPDPKRNGGGPVSTVQPGCSCPK